MCLQLRLLQNATVSVMSQIKDALFAILPHIRDDVLSVHDVGIIFHK